MKKTLFGLLIAIFFACNNEAEKDANRDTTVIEYKNDVNKNNSDRGMGGDTSIHKTDTVNQ